MDNIYSINNCSNNLRVALQYICFAPLRLPETCTNCIKDNNPSTWTKAKP
ncbi:hypothetical protein EXN66_Car015979 [Channa argus]|uniref:Uncharacterized protein n=1 Tax=Channa argus TaxID=215402 RepID=A0A6G1QCL9_CHAAH|nr:hypothetical protein EXN66_Car015979 [Channa argus]